MTAPKSIDADHKAASKLVNRCPCCGKKADIIRHVGQRAPDTITHWSVECSDSCMGAPCVVGLSPMEVASIWNLMPRVRS